MYFTIAITGNRFIMDTNTLRSFIAIADHGSFTAAAEQLHLTQPAISKRIQALESELRTTLFDRIGRTVTLTEAGDVLYQHAKNILRDMENSRVEIANLTTRVRGSLAFATSHHIGLHRLPVYLKQFSSTHKELEFDIHFMDSEAACLAVQNGRFEFAVVTLPAQHYASLETQPLWEDKLVAVCGKSHPLAKQLKSSARRQATLDVGMLSRFPAILPEKSTFTFQLINAAFKQRGVELKTAMATNYLETIKMLVSVGLGWSMLPAVMVNSSMITLNVSKLNVSRRLGVVRHTARTLSNASREFIRRLMEISGD